MCGIAGIWNLREGDRSGAVVAAMLDAMPHRGPDGRGALTFEGGAAGMVRLALVDLSNRGQQPLWSADRQVAILFNGEIYNFRAERERLEQAGARFHTTTDTEVILHLYLERGIEFVERLRGMYSIAIFDWRQSSTAGPPVMVLVRGPLGVKPLYIASPPSDPAAVMFSSEIRPLLASGLIPRQVSQDGLADYLQCGFVMQPRTIVSGVRMMAPGMLERFVPGRPVETHRFWRIPPSEPRQETLDEAAQRLRGVLDESVALHAFADAPVGAFLSGGVDSSGVVGLMRKHVSDLRTYTLKYPDFPQLDESEYATATARQLDCRNTIVEIRGADMPELLPQFARAMDQPSIDGLNTWIISRAAARDVKAVLSGIGGDEWFTGYPVTRRMSYYALSPMGRAKALAGKIAAQLSDMLPDGHLRQRACNLATRRSPLATWMHAHSLFRYDQARQMVGMTFESCGDIKQFESYLADLRPDFRRETPVGLACLLDFGIYMGSQLLRDSDVMSMAHSLELRTPLVDLEVANMSRTCRDEYKLITGGGIDGRYAASGAKRVLIEAMRDVLPDDIGRRPKRGFALPIVQWMQKDLKSLVLDTCHPDTIGRRGLIDPTAVAPMVRTPEAVRANLHPRLWGLMLFELWCRATLDAPLESMVSKTHVG